MALAAVLPPPPASGDPLALAEAVARQVQHSQTVLRLLQGRHEHLPLHSTAQHNTTEHSYIDCNSR
jgi:hypothetical protein